MQTFQLSAHVNKNSIVQLQLPPEFSDKTIDIVVVVQQNANSHKTAWQTFIDNTYGSFANDLLERPEQLAIESRLELL